VVEQPSPADGSDTTSEPPLEHDTMQDTMNDTMIAMTGADTAMRTLIFQPARSYKETPADILT